ncbi:hypothetical protein BDV18DRAFT_161544 [Aspergillus unguis]
MAHDTKLSKSQPWSQREQRPQRPSNRALDMPDWRCPNLKLPVSHMCDESLTSSANDSTSSKHKSAALEEGRRIYIGNLPYVAKDNDIQRFLEQENYELTKLDISIDPISGRNPSYCFVELATKDQADLAMKELTGRLFMGRPLKVKPCTPKRRDDQRDPPSFVFNRWERNDASRHFKGNSANGRRLKVSGLPKPPSQAYMNQHLAEFFKGFAIEAIGKTVCPHYHTGAPPNMSRYAYVDFSSEEAAEAAMEMLDGTVGPWGRKLKLTKGRDWIG